MLVKRYFNQQNNHEGKPHNFLDKSILKHLPCSPSATHRGRQYIFELNPYVSVDATFAGNEARFINHSTTPNCHALGKTATYVNLSFSL